MGKLDEKEGAFKVSVPRGDRDVRATGVRMAPPMGLTSWASFEHVGQHTVVRGDMVQLEDQVNPIMSATFDNDLDVTALHNYFLWETPRVMFMHIGGEGGMPHAEIDPANSSLDPAKIEAVLLRKGDLSSGVYKVVVGRPTRMHGGVMGSTMGIDTWAAFAGSDDQAVVDCDFAMLEAELQPVPMALRRSGINIVAIHQRMTGESPRINFLHYWGIGSAQALAEGLRAALDKTQESKRRNVQ